MEYQNEITVKVMMTLEELIIFLKQNHYQEKGKYNIVDIYYVKKGVDLNKSPLLIFQNCVLLRQINHKFYYVYKSKEYDKFENIIRQGKVQVEVGSLKQAQVFLETMDYYELIRIKDEVTIYAKGELELALEYVNHQYLLLEIEESKKYNSITKLIKALNQTKIKYDTSNYFVQKTRIEFEKQYRN